MSSFFPKNNNLLHINKVETYQTPYIPNKDLQIFCQGFKQQKKVKNKNKHCIDV